MANYKLKYAGEKIDELLTKIDNLGVGTDTKSGTVKLSSATDSDSGVSDGVAATPAAVKAVKAAADDANSELETVKQQVENITPDNSTIGDKPWSSKHIIDMLCPPLEESGNPVVCYPVAGYPLGVKAKWEPAQEGSGTPSPENIRSIKGRDSVTVERCGENLLDISAFSLDVDKDNRTYQTKVQQLIPPGKYTLKLTHTNPNSGLGMQVFTRNGNKVSLISGQTFNLDGICNSIYFYISNVSGNADSIKDIMLIPSTATATTTTYTPYTGQTNTLTLPETVYGGEVDAVTGEGQGTWKMLTLDGTESWEKHVDWNIGGRNAYRVNNADIGAKIELNSPAICSHFPSAKYISATNTVDLSGSCICKGKKSFVVILDDANLETVDKWKTYLAEQYSAGSPIQVAFSKGTITPFTATGAQSIPALAGVNTVLTDADSATVTGRADPIKRIEDLEAAVASIN